MENRRTRAGCRPHRLPCLPLHRGKASRCRRARRGSRCQTREEVRTQGIRGVGADHSLRYRTAEFDDQNAATAVYAAHERFFKEAREPEIFLGFAFRLV